MLFNFGKFLNNILFLKKMWPLRIIVILFVFLTDFLWLLRINIHIEDSSILSATKTILEIILLCTISSLLPTIGFFTNPKSSKILHSVLTSVGVLIFLCLFIYAMDIASYATITLRVHLYDAMYAHADRLIGFNWLNYFKFVTYNYWICQILFYAYNSITLQMIFIVIYFGLVGDIYRLEEFVDILMIASFIAIFISIFAMAHSAFYFYGVTNFPGAQMISDFSQLRNGTLNAINLSKMQGLISMPSMHTCLAIMFTYSMRDSRLLSMIIILNSLMICSTPVFGGHYLVDILAGAVLAISTIFIFRMTSSLFIKI
jgi:hypothetical protein